ncbi:urease accessory protein UreE [Nevskia ramosa]|uniref:urease accessory protein UreE n=1 Tax=Nevskia ramosa TaxID=64002 RepID=UPI0003B2FAD5|nr:urease accessory protein UreE [Nevskia ramosa]
MLTITKRLGDGAHAATIKIELPFDLRTRSRQLTKLSTGEEVGLRLERGLVLRGGDHLITDDGRVVEIVAMDEVVSTVTCDDPWRLARASYHLGNRHVPVQIGAGWLRFRHDHVLDEMLRGQGYTVTVEEAPFEPEGGAYGGHGHGHSHGHG